ncbi:MAG: cytochrome c biogenesis protein CcsA [Planctomycetales bacterium]|nr:cytochrome c biogenesis protein CcsA [Planctomycetales bacterium]
MELQKLKCGRLEPLGGILFAALLAGVGFLILRVAPAEKTMGEVQRIVYVHVAVATFGMFGMLLAAAAGLALLVRRDQGWDHWGRAAAEVGWLCSTLTLITGSLWAHEAWNTWWTWEPRLTSSLILWTIYAGYFLLRSSIDNDRQQARVCAILAIVGALDIPIITMATRWFRGMHPVSPEMDPTMRGVLLASMVSLTCFFAYLLVRRSVQLQMGHRIRALRQRLLFEQGVRM